MRNPAIGKCTSANAFSRCLVARGPLPAHKALERDRWPPEFPLLFRLHVSSPAVLSPPTGYNQTIHHNLGHLA